MLKIIRYLQFSPRLYSGESRIRESEFRRKSNKDNISGFWLLTPEFLHRVLNNDSFDSCDPITTKYANPESCENNLSPFGRHPKNDLDQEGKPDHNNQNPKPIG